MATKEQIDLLRSANEANKRFANELFAKLEKGEQLRPEHELFLEEFIQEQEDRLKARNLLKEAGQRPLTPEENAFLEEFEIGLTGGEQIQTVDPRTGVPRVERVPERRSKQLEDIFAKTNLSKDLQEKLGKGLSEIAPIADVQLEDGETVLTKYLKKELGDKNVLASGDKERFFIRGGAGQTFQPLPRQAILPYLGRGAMTLGLGIGGEELGRFAGAFAGMPIKGAATGAALGSGLGEGINITNAINFAKQKGVVTGDEPILQEKLKQEAGIAAGLGGFFGGGAGTVKGIARGIGTAIEEGAPLGKSISQGMRAESQTMAQETANQARALGLRGKDISSLKGEVEQQGTIDALMAKFAALPDEPVAGKIARESLDNYVKEINQESDALFQQAIANTEQSLAKGKPVATVDITNLYNAFEKKLLREASANDKGKVQAFLDTLKNELNYTKQQIASGELPVKGAAAKQFSSDVVEQGIKDTTIFGPGQLTETVSQKITPSFDPTKFTARDFNKTKNFIKDRLQKLEDPEFILDKNTRKNITQFLKALETPFAGSADEAGDIALASGIDPADLVKNNELLKFSPKAPKGTSDFQKIAQGYEKRKEGFVVAPRELRQMVFQAPTDAAIEKQLFNLDSDLAGKLKNVIAENPEAKQTFELAVEKNLYQRAPREAQRKVQPTQDAYLQSQLASQDEILAAQKAGIKPELGSVQETIIPIQERTRELESSFAGAKVRKDLNKNRTFRALLGPEKTQEVLQDSSRLGAAQAEAGKKVSLFDNAIGAGGDEGVPKSSGIGRGLGSAIGAGAGMKMSGDPFVGGGVGALIGGGLGESIEKTGAKAIRPGLRFTADVLESARTVPLAPAKDVASLLFEPSRNLTEDEILQAEKKGFNIRKPGTIPSSSFGGLFGR